MTTDTLTLTAFLLARIEEDEAVARETLADMPRWDEAWGEGVSADSLPAVRLAARYSPDRVIAECAVKRAVVDAHSPPTAWRGEPYDGEPEGTLYEPEPYQADQCATCGYAEAWEVEENGPTYPCATLRALAAVYADHESYRAEWAL